MRRSCAAVPPVAGAPGAIAIRRRPLATWRPRARGSCACSPGIQSPAIGHAPEHWQARADAELDLGRDVARYLDHELVGAADTQLGADVVPDIDEVEDLRVDAVLDALSRRRRTEADAFRP